MDLLDRSRVETHRQAQIPTQPPSPFPYPPALETSLAIPRQSHRRLVRLPEHSGDRDYEVPADAWPPSLRIRVPV